jgi:AcrR family transcriptional regulator
MDPTDRKQVLLTAAKELVWERGVAATSPSMVLARSGQKQGALYHYYPEKRAWAEAAIQALAADLMSETEELFAVHGKGLAALRAYLLTPRSSLRGCRLGRLAFDPGVMNDPALRAPVQRYFEWLRGLLRQSLAEAGCRPELQEEMVETICAVVQGGYVTSRLGDDGESLLRACKGLISLVEMGPARHTRPRSLS